VADTVDVGKADIYTLVGGEGDSCDACHRGPFSLVALKNG
jgi:hypothetical protein